MECTAVVQVEVELLTGRAHQIRGQLTNLGFPLCGDAMYGGTAPPISELDSVQTVGGYLNSDQLALQCCELQFLDPDYEINKKGDEVSVRSDRVNKFRLEKAWWTPHLNQYASETEGDTLNVVTTDANDLATAGKMKESIAAIVSLDDKQSTESEQQTKIIRNVQLSPGKHKYIVIKATHPGLIRPDWYVKTASPRECGGPYHADVARDLVRELNNDGYDTIVMGGGRIDYDSVKQHAHVYGFSYGFGKGDHELVSLLIEKVGISASFDDSDALY